MGKQIDALTAQKSCLVDFGPANSGVYSDGLATIYAPNAIFDFDFWDSHSTMDGRNR